MGFTGDDIEPLDYDFSKFGGPKGTIPEPSQEAMLAYRLLEAEKTRYLAVLQEKVGEAKDLTGKTNAAKKLQNAATEVDREMDEAFAKLVQIDHDDLLKLPFRVRRAFTNWVMENLTPEG